MDNFRAAIEAAVSVPFVLAIIIGSIAGVMYRGIKSKRKAVQDVFVAAFTGWLVYQFMGDFEVWGGPKASLVGAASWLGPAVIDRVTAIIMRKFGVEPTSNWDGVERRKHPRD